MVRLQLIPLLSTISTMKLRPDIKYCLLVWDLTIVSIIIINWLSFVEKTGLADFALPQAKHEKNIGI